MGETKRNGGHQKGAQQHDEGAYGPKAKNFQEHELRTPADRNQDAERRAEPGKDSERVHGEGGELHSQYMSGENHLVGDYHPQHDEADQNSEKTRRAKKVEDEGLVPSDQFAERSVRASAKRKS